MSHEGSVVIDKVYATHVRENYASIVGAVAPKKLDEVVAGLEKHFASLKCELAQCDVCGGWSPEALPDGTSIEACPFCNDGKDVGASASPPPPAPTPSAPVVDIAQAKAKRTKVEKAGPTASSAPLATTAPAPMILAGSRAGSEAELDEALTRFRAAAETGADSLYLMGVELKKMRDYLWQQRRASDGKPKFKSYKQFVEEEVGISHGTETRARRIAENFTRDQFRHYGAKFLMVMIAAPKEEHAQLLEKIDSGAISAPKDLEKEVRQIREEKGVEVIETDAIKTAAEQGRNVPTAAATTAAAKAKRKEGAAITLGLKSETFTLKLMAKPEKKGDDEERRARTLEDKPYGVLETINGVKLYLAVKVTPAGELEIRGTAKREADE